MARSSGATKFESKSSATTRRSQPSPPRSPLRPTLGPNPRPATARRNQPSVPTLLNPQASPREPTQEHAVPCREPFRAPEGPIRPRARDEEPRRRHRAVVSLHPGCNSVAITEHCDSSCTYPAFCNQCRTLFGCTAPTFPKIFGSTAPRSSAGQPQDLRLHSPLNVSQDLRLHSVLVHSPSAQRKPGPGPRSALPECTVHTGPRRTDCADS